MAEQFLKIVNMSISASWLVLAVIVLRFLFRKAPKRINVLLWGIVAVRLLCFFSIESAFSLVPSAETISPEIMMDWTPEIDTGFTVLNKTVNPIITETFAPEPIASANPLQILIPIASVLWLAGIAVLLLYTAFSYVLLKRKVSTAVLLRYNVFQSEHVITPFVLGIIQPKIYLPYTMSNTDMIHVISHEKAHIRRHDHWWKPLGFLLLSVHWFNPIMWIAYKLFCKDMELACDEKVIQNMNNGQRADYAQALLSCSVKPRLVSACPIAFGEVGVKTRIKSIMNYKKPAFWLLLTAAAVCIAVAMCFLTDPKTEVAYKDSAQETARDLSSILELVVPGKNYQDMDSARKASILSEYGDLLDGYALVARESTDGTVAHIAGCFEGNLEDNPLKDMKPYTYGEDFIQILGSEEEIKAAEEALESQLTPQASYTLRNSRIWYEPENGTILIEAKDAAITLVYAYTKYGNPSLGSAYIQDAVARGVALYSVGPYLSVKVHSERWGEVYEKIPLTNEEVEKILSEERMFVGSDFEAALFYMNGNELMGTHFNNHLGVPQTVIDLAAKVTGLTVPAEKADVGQKMVSDMAYFMERIPNVTFRGMDAEKKEEILSEYGDLLDGYTMMARESSDGKQSYIVGYYDGNAEDSPLNDLHTYSTGSLKDPVQVLYPEEEYMSVRAAVDLGEDPENGYVIRNSTINHCKETGYFLISPKDSSEDFRKIFNQYLQPNGRAYMLDAVSRGIALYTPSVPYLQVSLISDQWGEVQEVIPLTELQASAILAEPRQKLDNGNGFYATLKPGAYSTIEVTSEGLQFTEFTGIPQTVLDLAVEKCGYRFASPEDIQSDIVEARLDCSWLEEPLYADEDDLQRLQQILENAEAGYVGKCGYSAKLTIQMADGSNMTLFKATDNCDSLIFGSYGGYFIGDQENTDFWTIFGLSAVSKEPLN